MSSVNDLEGCTYMSQSLPFGGCKKSGFDRFAGPEGVSDCMICMRLKVFAVVCKYVCAVLQLHCSERYGILV
jgi:acyl-CoA reductase-like NAD-dependent aldehyde dehydrogenase